MYKKLKYELTINYLYNENKYNKPYRQTIWHICKYFNVDFNSQRYSAITDFGYVFGMRLRIETHYLFLNDKMLIDYANAHNISIYDIQEHKIINSV